VPPTSVQASTADGVALANGADTERVVLQILDPFGAPASYVRDIYVTVDNGAAIGALALSGCAGMDQTQKDTATGAGIGLRRGDR